MKNSIIYVFIWCFFSTILLGQKPKQNFSTKFRQQLQLSLQNDNRGSSTFLLEKIDGYEGSTFVIEPNEFPSIFETFGYFPDYRLKNKTTKDGSSSYRQDFTYLNATDNLYSSIKTSYGGSFNQKRIDSFFYDNQKERLLM